MLDAQPLTLAHPDVRASKDAWEATKTSQAWAARGYTFDELFECFKADCVRHAALAREIGISRERVRQVYDAYFADLFDKTGRKRQQACTLEHRLVAYKRLETEFFNAPPYKTLFDKALAAGCELAGVPRVSSMPELMVSRVRVNSHLCSLQIAEKGLVARHGNRTYARVIIPSCVAEIDAMLVLTKLADFPERVFVLPVHTFGPSLPKVGRNLYLPTEKRPPYKGILPKVPWWDYEEAWHLLPQPPDKQTAP